jgi:hypothetical protein
MPARVTVTAVVIRTSWATFADQPAKLPDNTLVYPGHDYITNNRLHDGS